jgi:hypothetical protein
MIHQLMKRIWSQLPLFLLLIIVLTSVMGLLYISVHQQYRAGANDPQIQISEDSALALANGAAVESVVPYEKVDLTFSLAPFVAVYDKNTTLVSSNAELNGRTPVVPSGVLQYTDIHGQDRITWQPQKGVRMAIVVTRYDDGFVVVGRSLREVEKRTAMLTAEVAIAWAITVGATAICLFIFPVTSKSKRSS